LPFAERLLWFCSALSSLPGQVPTHDVNSAAEGNVLADEAIPPFFFHLGIVFFTNFY